MISLGTPINAPSFRRKKLHLHLFPLAGNPRLLQSVHLRQPARSVNAGLLLGLPGNLQGPFPAGHVRPQASGHGLHGKIRNLPGPRPTKRRVRAPQHCPGHFLQRRLRAHISAAVVRVRGIDVRIEIPGSHIPGSPLGQQHRAAPFLRQQPPGRPQPVRRIPPVVAFQGIPVGRQPQYRPQRRAGFRVRHLDQPRPVVQRLAEAAVHADFHPAAAPARQRGAHILPGPSGRLQHLPVHLPGVVRLNGIVGRGVSVGKAEYHLFRRRFPFRRQLLPQGSGVFHCKADVIHARQNAAGVLLLPKGYLGRQGTFHALGQLGVGKAHQRHGSDGRNVCRGISKFQHIFSCFRVFSRNTAQLPAMARPFTSGRGRKFARLCRYRRLLSYHPPGQNAIACKSTFSRRNRPGSSALPARACRKSPCPDSRFPCCGRCWPPRWGSPFSSPQSAA